jgi:hypothetical protein
VDLELIVVLLRNKILSALNEVYESLYFRHFWHGGVKNEMNTSHGTTAPYHYSGSRRMRNSG